MAYCRWKPGALAHEVVYVWRCGSCAYKFDVAWLVVVFMFDALHVRLTSSSSSSSSPSCDTMWICCVLAHKASPSDTHRSLLQIVVIVVAVAWYDMKMPVVVAAVINSSCACARWLMDSSCACAWWLIAWIVVCCRCRMTIQSASWSSCACAWVAWRWHMMLLQPIGCRCCHHVMRYDNMVCLYIISHYSLSLLCDTDKKQKEGGCWQHMLLLHPRCCCRRCYTTLIVIKNSCHLCFWANRAVVLLLSLHPVDCRLFLWWLTIYETLVRLHMSG